MLENPKSELRIIPLGGLGEIGLNMMVFEQGEDILIVDCGLMFPGDAFPGVDYVIPNFSYLADKAERIRGIIITHGHEDHTGGLPFLLRDISAPVYGTPLTIGIITEKLKEYHLADKTELIVIQAGDMIKLGSFEIEFIRVSHSIADCVALAIKTCLGNIIHTGDFKLDPYPIDDKKVDIASFARYGDKGVTALLSDSTNAERSGFTLSEREVGKALDEVFKEVDGRLILATFASNIHRIQQVMNLAHRHGRKVAVMGRSMLANTRIGKELGYLKIPKGVMCDAGQIRKIPDSKMVLLTTGTQGEPLSGLSRMARDEHKQIKIRKGDTVVFSSRFIPGNERAIGFLINEFYRRGADVIYERVSDIHVSGHASQEELKLMISLTRPEYFIPVHGEYRHLARHAQLASSVGIPKDRIMVAEDGDAIHFTDVGGKKVGRVDAGRQVVDGTFVADSADMVLQQRRKIARDGVVIAIACLDTEDGSLIRPLEFTSRGFLFEHDEDDIFTKMRDHVEEELLEMPEKTWADKGLFEEQLFACVKRYIKKKLIRFPSIIPVVLEY
jgi:ribonuclease J